MRTIDNPPSDERRKINGRKFLCSHHYCRPETKGNRLSLASILVCFPNPPFHLSHFYLNKLAIIVLIDVITYDMDFLRSFCVLFTVSLVGGSFRIKFLLKSKVFLSGVSLVRERNHSSGRKLLSKFHFLCETFVNISFEEKF